MIERIEKKEERRRKEEKGNDGKNDERNWNERCRM